MFGVAMGRYIDAKIHEHIDYFHLVIHSKLVS